MKALNRTSERSDIFLPMAFIRAAALILTLLLFVAAGAPLLYLARRFNWPLQKIIPRLFHKSMCALIGIRVQLYGVPDTSRPQLLVANHVSWTDIIVLGSVMDLCFLAKKEVRGWPLFGLFARLDGTVFVDRGRLRLIKAVNALLCERLGAGDVIVLFAEATTGDGTRLRKFHSSHFAAILAAANGSSAAVQPASISYTRRNGLPLDRKDRASVAWYGDTDMAPHLLGLLSAGPVVCEVCLMPPLGVTPDMDRKAVAAAARQAVQAGLAAIRSRQALSPAGRAHPDQSCFQGVQKGLHQG